MSFKFNPLTGNLDYYEQSSSSGGGITTPDTTVNNSIVRWDGTTGEAIQGYTANSPTIDDNGVASFPDNDHSNTLRMGENSGVAGDSCISIGSDAVHTSGGKSVTIGHQTRSTDKCVVIGQSTTISHTKGEAVAIGAAVACGYWSVVIGSDTLYASVNNFVSVGYNHQVSNHTITLGQRAKGTGDNAIAIGRTAEAVTGCVAVGALSKANGADSVAVGYNSDALGARSFTLGFNTTDNSYNDCVCLGYGASATKSNQFVMGAINGWLDEFYFGRGVSTSMGASANHTRWALTRQTGTDAPGSDWTFEAGTSTGDELGGDFIFKTSPSGSSGSAENNAVERVRIGGDGETTFSGAISKPITTLSTNTTLNEAHYTVVVDTTSENVTITLPSAASASGRIYRIKKISESHSVIIDPNASETIDGATSSTLSSSHAKLAIQSDGTEWWII